MNSHDRSTNQLIAIIEARQHERNPPRHLNESVSLDVEMAWIDTRLSGWVSGVLGVITLFADDL